MVQKKLAELGHYKGAIDGQFGPKSKAAFASFQKSQGLEVNGELDMKTPEGKKFYGSVTVSERGQVVIPTEARKDFDIKTGDKLLVFGDLEKGLGIATFNIMQKSMKGTTELFREINSTMKNKENK